MKKTPKKTPRTLCKQAVAWREAALAEREFEQAELALLHANAELLGTYYAALEQLHSEGFVVRGTRGPRVNPLATVCRQSLETFAKVSRQLGIGSSDKGKPGRPWAGQPPEMKGSRDVR